MLEKPPDAIDCTLCVRVFHLAGGVAAVPDDQQQQQQQLFCPGRFDGYICWPQTAAGRTITDYCPDFIVGFDKRLLAHKE